MANNERSHNADPCAYEIVGPGEYYVPIVLMYTTDQAKADAYFEKLLKDAPRMDQEGLKKVPYCMYEVARKVVRSMNNA
jgi:hypothetical protein